MPRGSPPGVRLGGRQKGTPNKSTAERKAREDAAHKAAFGVLEPSAVAEMSPLEILLRVARAALVLGSYALAVSAAEKAAPYLHERKGIAPVIDDCGPTPDEIAADGDPEVKE